MRASPEEKNQWRRQFGQGGEIFTGNVLAGNFYLTKNGLKFKKIHRGLMNPKDSTSFANFALQQCCMETYP